jgi:hypothetical protein
MRPGRGRRAAGWGHRVQMAGGTAGSGGLDGVVLGGPQLGYGVGERGEAENQAGGREGAGTLADGPEEPRGVAELVAGAGTGRDAAVRRAGGAVVGVGSAAQPGAAKHAGGVGGAGRVGGGAAADVIRGGPRLAGGVLVGGAAVGGGDPARDGVP